jgi:hypothetical protein
MELLTASVILLLMAGGAWLIVKVLHARQQLRRRFIEGERNSDSPGGEPD